MKNSRHIIAFVSLLVLLISITWTEDARADESNRKTVFTINHPVRAPGNIILPPGKYMMKLMDSTMRDVVSIMDANETKIYTTFFAVPEELLNPAEEALMLLNIWPGIILNGFTLLKKVFLIGRKKDFRLWASMFGNMPIILNIKIAARITLPDGGTW